MSALDELIYDRTQADVTYAAELNRKFGRGEALTSQELADWNTGLKGAYNAADMNRVGAAVRELGGLLTAAGYPVRYTSPVPQPEPEYTQLSYIESTGTQYIDTGINDEYILSMTVQFTNTGARNLMGQSSNAGNYFGSTADGYFELGGDAISTVKATEKHRITVISTKTNITLTVEQGDTIVRDKTSAADTNLMICGGVSGYVCNAKIWDCTISTISGDMIRNFVPAEKDGIIGLYDKVEGKIYTNAGTGDFIAGESIIKPEPEPEPEKTEFEIGDIINYDIWWTYIDNVQAIRDAYYTMPDTPKLPEPTAPLTYDGANAIERLIYDILMLYEGMVYRYRICGTFTAGNNYNRQYIRSV